MGRWRDDRSRSLKSTSSKSAGNVGNCHQLGKEPVSEEDRMIDTYNGGVELERVDLDTEGGCGASAKVQSDGAS